MRLYLARHGEAEHQTQGVLGGRGPYPLTLRGREQAAALGRRIRVLPLAAAYVSPTLRAQQTAEIALEGRLKMVLADDLAEQDWGKLTGVPLAQVVESCPGLFEHWNPPADSGGETRQDLWNRVAPAVEEILATHGDSGDLLLVSHGGAIHVAAMHLMGLGPDSRLAFLTSPASLCGFELSKGRTRLLFLNETGYLADL